MARGKKSDPVAEDWLREEAGGRVFERGVEYHSRGLVSIASLNASAVSGEVRGSKLYRVAIRGGRSASCTCLAFDREGMCKHVVALGLAANAVAREGGAFVSPEDRIRGYLGQLDAPKLRALLLGLAIRDPGVRKQLEDAIAFASADDATLERHLSEAVEEVVDTPDYLSYDEVGPWVASLNATIGSIAAALDAGRAAAVLTPLTVLFDGLDEALGAIDDSNGEGQACYARAQELHVRACAMARPDPVKLARDLFRREADGEYDLFDGAAAVYAESLGKRGLAEYRRLVEAAWAKVKPAALRKRGVYVDGSWKTRRLGEMMEALIAESDVDGRIAVRAKLLSSAHDYVELANLCLSAGRKTEALKWLEEGLFVLDDGRDGRLVTLAARLRRETGDEAGGLALLWNTFEREPGLDVYKAIVAVTPAGQPSAEAKERAIVFLRTWPSKKPARAFLNGSVTALLVEILILEDRLSEAWRALDASPLDGEIVRRLAGLSEAGLPDKALNFYIRSVEHALRMGGGDYTDAVRKIGKVQALRARLGQEDQHATWLESLRVQHKAKRNFIKALNQAGM